MMERINVGGDMLAKFPWELTPHDGGEPAIVYALNAVGALARYLSAHPDCLHVTVRLMSDNE